MEAITIWNTDLTHYTALNRNLHNFLKLGVVKLEQVAKNFIIVKGHRTDLEELYKT